jgi:hypothetical protein
LLEDVHTIIDACLDTYVTERSALTEPNVTRLPAGFEPGLHWASCAN